MRILMMIIATGLIICSNLADADVYSWTDEDGVKRFSNRPPDGDIKDLQAVKEIPYDEEVAAFRKAVKKEREEERLAEEKKQYRENIQNYYMQDRMLLERRLQKTENQLKDLEQELKKSEDSGKRSSSYYPYWPAYPCWPNCGDKPGRPRPPRPPYDRPPGVKPPQARPPVYPVPYQMSDKSALKSGQHRKSRQQHSHKPSRPVKSAPIASPAIR